MSGSTSNTIGSGSDTISLRMSEDQAQGVDAQFTLNVDGQQIGGPQSVSASHAAGQDETFNFAGDYGPGSHTVTVTFANNFLLPGTSGDRNLFVDGVSYDGQTVSSTSKGIFEGPFYTPNNPNGTNYGNAVYSVNDTTPVPAGASSAASTTPGAVSVGSGPDTLILHMSEDPYQGDAQFTVSVDGKPVGGTLTTTAITNQGQQQEFDIHGSFGGGSHTVSVAFVNDHIGALYPGTTLAVATRTLWRYFPSKEACAAPLLSFGLDRFTSYVRDWPADRPLAEAADDTRWFSDTSPTRLLLVIDLLRLTHTEPLLDAVWSRCYSEAVAPLAVVLGERLGRPADDLRVKVKASMLLASMHQGLRHYVCRAPGEYGLSVEDTIRTAARIGLAAAEAEDVGIW